MLEEEEEEEEEDKMLAWKTKADWIMQAKEALRKAEGYGAFKIENMREEEMSLLRQAMKVLGVCVKF